MSLISFAIGAILTWAVGSNSAGFNLTAVGVILMVAGFVGAVVSFGLWSLWWGSGQRRYHAVVSAERRRPQLFFVDMPVRADEIGRETSPTRRQAGSARSSRGRRARRR